MATGPPGRGGSRRITPGGHLPFGARHKRFERGRRAVAIVARGAGAGRQAASARLASGFRSGLAADWFVAASPSATAPAGFGARTATATGRGSRPRAAGQGVDEIARPRVRDDHPARGQDNEDWRAPEADDVVPIEVARLATKAGAEERHRGEMAPGPLPWPPQINPRDGQHEKRGIAGAGDRAGRGTVLAFDREVAVPARNRSIECARPRRARPEDVARVRVDEDRSPLPERHRRGDARIGVERHGRRLGVRHGLPDPGEQHVDVQPAGACGHLDEPLRSLDHFEHRLLERQQGTRDRHDQDDHAGDEASGEVGPE